eukprot:scpid16997/ scgid2856/ Pleckstrin homology domain-containing family G member 7
MSTPIAEQKTPKSLRCQYSTKPEKNHSRKMQAVAMAAAAAVAARRTSQPAAMSSPQVPSHSVHIGAPHARKRQSLPSGGQEKDARHCRLFSDPTDYVPRDDNTPAVSDTASNADKKDEQAHLNTTDTATDSDKLPMYPMMRHDNPYRQPFKKKAQPDSPGPKRQQPASQGSDDLMTVAKGTGGTSESSGHDNPPSINKLDPGRNGSSNNMFLFPQDGHDDSVHGSQRMSTRGQSRTFNNGVQTSFSSVDSATEHRGLLHRTMGVSESSGDVDAASCAPAQSISDVSEASVVMLNSSRRDSPVLTTSSSSTSSGSHLPSTYEVNEAPPPSASSTLTRQPDSLASPPLSPPVNLNQVARRLKANEVSDVDVDDGVDSMSTDSVISDPVFGRGAVGRRSFIRVKELKTLDYYPDTSLSEEEIDVSGFDEDGLATLQRKMDHSKKSQGKLFNDKELDAFVTSAPDIHSLSRGISTPNTVKMPSIRLGSDMDDDSPRTPVPEPRAEQRPSLSLQRPPAGDVRRMLRMPHVVSDSPVSSMDEMEGHAGCGRTLARRNDSIEFAVPQLDLNNTMFKSLPHDGRPRATRKHSLLPHQPNSDPIAGAMRPTLTVDGVVVVTGRGSDTEGPNILLSGDEGGSQRNSVSSNDDNSFSIHVPKSGASDGMRSLQTHLSLNIPSIARGGGDDGARQMPTHKTLQPSLTVDGSLLAPRNAPPSPLIMKKDMLQNRDTRSPSPTSLTIPGSYHKAHGNRTSLPVLQDPRQVSPSVERKILRRHSSAENASTMALRNKYAKRPSGSVSTANDVGAGSLISEMEEHYSVSLIQQSRDAVGRSGSLSEAIAMSPESAVFSPTESKDTDGFAINRSNTAPASLDDKLQSRPGKRKLGFKLFRRASKLKDLQVDRIETALSKIDLPKRSKHDLAVYVDSSCTLNWYHVVPSFDSYPIMEAHELPFVTSHHHHHHYLAESRRFDCDKAPSCGTHSYCTDNERRRRQSIWELFRSECAYFVDSLLVLAEIFKPTLEQLQSHGFMRDVDVYRVFGNLDEISKSSDDLCKRILGLFINHGPGRMGCMDDVAGVFDHFAWRVHTPYSLYAENFYNSASYVHELGHRRDFTLYEKFCKKNPRVRRRSLKDFLIEPVTHLPRFILVFKDIEKSMKRDSQPADLQLLTSTITAISLSCQQTESKFREFELIRIASELSSAIVWPKFQQLDPRAVVPDGLLVNGRNPVHSIEPLDLEYTDERYLKHFGMLKLYERQPNSSANSRMTSVNTAVFLFNDMLLVTKPVMKGRPSVSSPMPHKSQVSLHLTTDGISVATVALSLAFN